MRLIKTCKEIFLYPIRNGTSTFYRQLLCHKFKPDSRLHAREKIQGIKELVFRMWPLILSSVWPDYTPLCLNEGQSKYCDIDELSDYLVITNASYTLDWFQGQLWHYCFSSWRISKQKSFELISCIEILKLFIFYKKNIISLPSLGVGALIMTKQCQQK